MSEWHNVSKAEKCPICGHDDWCNLSNDGAVCICHRVESPHLAKSGSGWIHALRANDERKRTWPRHSPATDSRQRTAAIDLGRVHAAYDADPILVEGLATTLGVDDEALKAMDVRFNRFDECWSFPMRNADGTIVGLRYRELAGSRKWSARGSRDGLFYPLPAASCPLPAAELIVVEGPSDTAALLSLFNQPPTTNSQPPTIVGRSSCQTGAAHLRQLIRRMRPRCVTIVADNDEPGIKGAGLLATQLATDRPKRILIVPHPHKDIRAWYLSGKLTARLFADMASAQTWR